MQRCQVSTSKGAPTSPPLYYRATPRAQVRQEREHVLDSSRYLRDVFEMCQRGIWERELRQFLPPASLRESVDSLLQLGLIERAEAPSQ